MELAFKPDFPEMQERMRAWFAHADTDRPIIQVTAPKAGMADRPAWSGWTLVHHLDDPDYALDLYEAYGATTFFGGEAFPNLWINLGPGIPAAYLGREPHIAEETVWFEGLGPMSWDEILSTQLEPDQRWWRMTRELTKRAVERGGGRFFVSITDLNGVLNILGSLRGTQQLLVDCLDEPEMVKRAAQHIADIWLRCFDELANVTRADQEGSSSWMGIWFPGVGSDVQSDFSAMLSPAMFEEFVMPDLVRQIRHVEQSIFHWDGPGQIAHLDLLLSIPELGGLQWVPGAGRPDTGSPQWFPLYKRVQAAGKLLVLQGMDADHVEGVVRELDPRGLLISTSCPTEEEARELLENVPKWARR